MKVYAFVGPSGTGKSHRALFVARLHDIQFLIDDGLLIHLNKKIAGYSAKRELTYIAAVKRAIFHHEDHRAEVKQALARLKAKSILLIGTSDEMVQKIADRLDLGPIEKTVYIHDVSSEQDIETARRMRSLHGKHVIPVPAVEIKADFSGYFLDKLKVFGFKRGSGVDMAEKTVVRPSFSYLGRYTISNKAMTQIVSFYTDRCLAIHDVLRVRFTELADGTGTAVDIEIVGHMGIPLPRALEECMRRIRDGLENMTQLNITAVNFYVKGMRE